ncbi:DUF4299 family protein [Pleionea mediterranea]|uniref:Uncharacterized protein DUF4299 n=1 Tax=Pleionea mediterranea TaxID=523701 RepID=A0A316FI35_9GAMM|nr:DUF4299 family protein [Pleionea mediterranea]PWK47386.1 uncharacterized protein DUF4299 [Pleionea mediterranea]
MSFTFAINDVNSLSFKRLIEVLGINDLQFVDSHKKPENDLWPDGFTYVFRNKQSARPLEVDYENKRVGVRVFTGSSVEDHQLAIDLTKAIAKLNNSSITPEDNEKLSLTEFSSEYGSEWAKESAYRSVESIISFQQKKNQACMINGVYSEMEVGDRLVKQLMSDKESMHQEFFERLKKLNYLSDDDVFESNNLVLQNEDGTRNVRMAVYPKNIATLIFDKNTLVTVADDLQNENQESDSPVVTVEQLSELVGEQAKWLSERVLLLPEISGDDWERLISKAESVSIKDIFEYGYDCGNDQFASKERLSDKLTEEDIEVLIYAPVVSFCMVAMADGKVDNKEVKAFQTELAKGIVTDSELMMYIITNVISRFDSLIIDIFEAKVDLREILQQINHVVNQKLSKEDGNKFKVAMLEIGKNVAEASGGFLGFFGSKISKEEERALSALVIALGIEL